MTAEAFEKLWIEQVGKEKEILLERAKQYSSDNDRLANFYSGGILNKATPLEYAFMLTTKHIMALRDLIERHRQGEPTTQNKIDEFCTDIRNYCVLMQAIHQDIANHQAYIKSL